MDDGSRLLKVMLSGHLKTKEDANGFMESIFSSLKEDSPFREFWIGVATRLHSLAIEKLEKEAVQIEAYLDEGKSFGVFDAIKLNESFDESKHLELLETLECYCDTLVSTDLQKLFEESATNEQYSILPLLLYCGADPTVNGYSYYLQMIKEVRMLDLFLEHHLPDESVLNTILYKSCLANNVQSVYCVKLLLNKYNVDPMFNEGQAFIICARLNKEISVAKTKLFLDTGKLTDKAKRRAYKWAFRQNYSPIKTLLDACSIPPCCDFFPHWCHCDLVVTK
jgi:hypothetical protein